MKTKPVRSPAKLAAGWKSGSAASTCSVISIFFLAVGGAALGSIRLGLAAGSSTELSTEIIGLLPGALPAPGSRSSSPARSSPPPARKSDDDDDDDAAGCGGGGAGAGSGAPISEMSGLLLRGRTFRPKALAISEPVPDMLPACLSSCLPALVERAAGLRGRVGGLLACLAGWLSWLASMAGLLVLACWQLLIGGRVITRKCGVRKLNHE